MKHTFRKHLATLIIGLTLAPLTMAATGSADTNSWASVNGGVSSKSVADIFQTILLYLEYISVPVVTCAIVWAGYKIIWGHRALEEVSSVVIGSLVIGAAPWLANLLIYGKTGF